jgi:hypothetical protein
MLTEPVAWAGVVAVIVLSSTTKTSVAAVPPMVTLVVPLKSAPVMVTLVPPSVVPLFGEMAVTVGAGVGKLATCSINPELPLE